MEIEFVDAARTLAEDATYHFRRDPAERHSSVVVKATLQAATSVFF